MTVQEKIQELQNLEENLGARFDIIQEDWEYLEGKLLESILKAAQLCMELDSTIQNIGLSSEDDECQVWAQRDGEEEPSTLASEEDNDELYELQDSLERFYALLVTNAELVISKETTLEELSQAISEDDEE
jgi:hypothetical protein